MQLLRKSDNPDYKYTLAFVGYGAPLPGWRNLAAAAQTLRST